jgi:hypothetical protein
MATPDLSSAEAILRELLEVRAGKDSLSPEAFRDRQRTAWQAARKLLGMKKDSKPAAAKG